MAAKENAEVVVLAAQIEADINELETFEEPTNVLGRIRS